MAKVSIKSEKITPFGGIFHVREAFFPFCGSGNRQSFWTSVHIVRLSKREVVEFYNLRGGKEHIFDDMNNGFGWARLPKSFMAENTVFLLLTALIRNFYKFIMARLDVKRFGLKATSRIKAFVFKFISVPAKWIRTARHYQLNIYTDNKLYQNPFAFTDG